MQRLVKGFSLTELMLACGMGLSLYGAMISFTVKLMQSHQLLNHKLQLEEEASALASALSSELQRAGYHGQLHAMWSPDQPSPMNPFAEHTQIGQYPGEPAGSCILFSYDTNQNGQLDLDLPNEQMGFRLREETVELRQNGQNCDAGGWHDLTSLQQVRVAQLEFSLHPVSPSQGSVLAINLSLSSTANANLSHSLSLQVRLRNVVR